MRIHVISDLHLAGRYTAPAEVAADITCIVGDLGAWVGPGAERTAAFLRAIPRPVYLVLGNHDFYGTSSRDIRDSYNLDPCFRRVLDACPHVHLLHNSGVVFNDGGRGDPDLVYFYGTPLWSGLDLPLPRPLPEEMARHIPPGMPPADIPHFLTRCGIRDFRTGTLRGFDRPWSTYDHVSAHRDAYPHLSYWLAGHTGRKRVVMTHWLPSEQCIAPQWLGHPLNCYFTALMDAVIEREQPELWLFGHTHSHVDTRIGRTRLVANPLGYAGEDSGFDPALVVEV